MRTVGLLAVLALMLPTHQVWAEGPKITFDKEVHDYGKVRYGETVTEEFLFSNAGDKTLVIEKLQSSCGCTKAVKGSDQVSPKEKSRIVAAFDTTGLRPGPKEKTITVHSNDPARPAVKLTLRADVVREIDVDPPSLAKNLPAFEPSISFPMVATNASDTPYTIKGVGNEPGGVEGVIEPAELVVPARKSANFTLMLKPQQSPNRHYFMGKLLLLTNHARENEIEIRYLIKVDKAE